MKEWLVLLRLLLGNAAQILSAPSIFNKKKLSNAGDLAREEPYAVFCGSWGQRFKFLPATHLQFTFHGFIWCHVRRRRRTANLQS